MKLMKKNTLEFLGYYKKPPAIWCRENPYHQNREVIGVLTDENKKLS